MPPPAVRPPAPPAPAGSRRGTRWLARGARRMSTPPDMATSTFFFSLIVIAPNKTCKMWKGYHRSTRANTPDSVSFRRFLLFSSWLAPASLQRNVARQHRREYADSASLRLKNQKSHENPSLAGAGQFCRSRNVSRQEKTRREYLPYCQGA